MAMLNMNRVTFFLWMVFSSCDSTKACCDDVGEQEHFICESSCRTFPQFDPHAKDISIRGGNFDEISIFTFPEHIKYIDIRDCSIQIIKAGAFAQLIQVVKMEFQSVNITHIQSKAFTHLNFGKSKGGRSFDTLLSFSNCNIQSVEYTAFNIIQGLDMIRFQKTTIFHSHDEAFRRIFMKRGTIRLFRVEVVIGNFPDISNIRNIVDIYIDRLQQNTLSSSLLGAPRIHSMTNCTFIKIDNNFLDIPSIRFIIIWHTIRVNCDNINQMISLVSRLPPQIIHSLECIHPRHLVGVNVIDLELQKLTAPSSRTSPKQMFSSTGMTEYSVDETSVFNPSVSTLNYVESSITHPVQSDQGPTLNKSIGDNTSVTLSKITTTYITPTFLRTTDSKDSTTNGKDRSVNDRRTIDKDAKYDEQSESRQGSNSSRTILIVIFGVIVLLIVIGAFVWYYKRKLRKSAVPVIAPGFEPGGFVMKDSQRNDTSSIPSPYLEARRPKVKYINGVLTYIKPDHDENWCRGICLVHTNTRTKPDEINPMHNLHNSPITDTAVQRTHTLETLRTASEDHKQSISSVFNTFDNFNCDDIIQSANELVANSTNQSENELVANSTNTNCKTSSKLTVDDEYEYTDMPRVYIPTIDCDPPASIPSEDSASNDAIIPVNHIQSVYTNNDIIFDPIQSNYISLDSNDISVNGTQEITIDVTSSDRQSDKSTTRSMDSSGDNSSLDSDIRIVVEDVSVARSINTSSNSVKSSEPENLSDIYQVINDSIISSHNSHGEITDVRDSLFSPNSTTDSLTSCHTDVNSSNASYDSVSNSSIPSSYNYAENDNYGLQ